MSATRSPLGSVVERKPGLAEVIIDDAVVIYDPAALSCHLLNSSAGTIWQLIDGRRTAEDILDELEHRFPTARDTLASDLQTGLAQITSSGLTAPETVPGQPETPASPVPADDSIQPAGSSDPVPDAPTPDGPAPTDAVAFRAIDYRFDLVGPTELLAGLTSSLRTLASTEPVDSRYTIRERLVEDGPQLDVRLDGELLGTSSPETVGDIVLQDVNRQVSEASSDRLLIHASAVLTAEGVLAFAGTTNAGKSTLVTGLVKAGYPYVTDETVAVRLHGLDVTAYPKPIGIDTGSYPLFPELEEKASPLARQRWWINPLDVGPASIAVPNLSNHPLVGLCFVQYESGQRFSAEPLEPAAAAIELTRNLFNLAHHPQPGLETVAHVVTSIPCWRIEHSDLGDLVDWVRDAHEPATAT